MKKLTFITAFTLLSFCSLAQTKVVKTADGQLPCTSEAVENINAVPVWKI